MNPLHTILFILLFSSLTTIAQQSQAFEMSVENIMRDPLWMGSFPSNSHWSESDTKFYFNWNPEKTTADSLYEYSLESKKIRKVGLKEQKEFTPKTGSWNKDKTKKIYAKHGDLYLYEKDKNTRQLLQTNKYEGSPYFSFGEKKIIFSKEDNLYSFDLKDGFIAQLTNFKSGFEAEKGEEETQNIQEKWLKEEELDLIKVLKEKEEERELTQTAKKQNQEKPKRPKSIYTGSKRLTRKALSPDGQYVIFQLSKETDDNKKTIVPSYVRTSGFTEDLPARPNVGRSSNEYTTGIYDLLNDTVYYANPEDLPNINGWSKYWINEDDLKLKKENKEPKPIYISRPIWAEDGVNAFVIIQSLDNKDRWIALLDPATGKLKNIDHQHDDAWIGGPGISQWRPYPNTENVGWLPDNEHIWFQSEESGYSHLHITNIYTGKNRQLTKGKYEVFDPKISKDQKHWYFTSSEGNSGQRHFYKMPIMGGKAEKLTSLKGNNQVSLSPNEEYLLIRHSYSNQPWELYLQKNTPNVKPVQITFSTSEEFKSYQWRDPEIVQFKAEDKEMVTARLYRPQQATPKGPAVIFVHGAGYLQNAHQWWSHYFREYMFHNLLVDLGYTVLDIDYRASAGYGRDWRTGIYRHMGGKDLSDQIDGAKYLAEEHDIDPQKIGIYGGSYGGFITIMALCQSEIFACGAALRSVTDWAHYNHEYTSNILNIPYIDSTAYRQSSPIYFAENLKNPLLMCHGMIDRNVHFQTVVRLSKRFIELGKDDWELAVYPLEGHGFQEPSSWTDEYKRILKLFEENLK